MPEFEIGGRVTKRGSEGAGEIIDYDKMGWVSVKWDDHEVRKPKICHYKELEPCR